MVCSFSGPVDGSRVYIPSNGLGAGSAQLNHAQVAAIGHAAFDQAQPVAHAPAGKPELVQVATNQIQAKAETEPLGETNVSNTPLLGTRKS